jgi:protein TonB
MSTHPHRAASHPSISSRFAAWRPTTRGLLMILGAFVLGLLMFLIVTGRQPGIAPPVAPTASRSGAPEFAPLPAPMPADAAGASGLEEPDEEALAERPRIIETPRPAPRPVAPANVPPPDTRAPSSAADAIPVPISSPSPRYPTRAMQRRESGTVRVQVQVGADGSPLDVSVLESSQSRDLDRAALEAVRKWRFRPAQKNGQPVVGTVIVPIAFKL